MTENPLSGISVPSVDELADGILSLLHGVQLDLSNPLHRERLRGALTRSLGYALNQMKDSILHGQHKAVEHIFRLMDDENYQRKRIKRQTKKRLERIADKKNEAFKKMKTASKIH